MNFISRKIGFGEGRVVARFVHLARIVLVQLVRVLGRYLQLTERLGDRFAERHEHPFKQIERFAFIFVQRVFLCISAQADTLAEVVQR